MFQDPDSVDEELGPDPSLDPLQPAHPRRQCPQAATERYRIAKLPLDPPSQPQQVAAKVVPHQVKAAQPVRALIVVSLARVRVWQRHHQLVASFGRLVKQRAGVVVAVAQQVTRSRRLRYQPPRHRLLGLIHGPYLPGLRHGAVRPKGMQLIAFGFSSRSSTPGRVGILADAGYGQRLAIEHGQQAGFASVTEVLLQLAQEGTHGEAVDASANGSAVGQTGRAELGGGPIPGAASPDQGSVVQGSPQQDGDQDPGLERDVFLVEALADSADSVVQRRPEFTFHDGSPW